MNVGCKEYITFLASYRIELICSLTVTCTDVNCH